MEMMELLCHGLVLYGLLSLAANRDPFLSSEISSVYITTVCIYAASILCLFVCLFVFPPLYAHDLCFNPSCQMVGYYAGYYCRMECSVGIWQEEAHVPVGPACMWATCQSCSTLFYPLLAKINAIL